MEPGVIAAVDPGDDEVEANAGVEHAEAEHGAVGGSAAARDARAPRTSHGSAETASWIEMQCDVLREGR